MYRRKFLSKSGAIGITATAGCSGAGSDVEGEVVVDETVYEGDIRRFNFEVEQGQMINIYINNIEGARTTVVLTDPDDNKVGEYEAETENTGTHDAQMSGVYAVNITSLGEAEVEVGLVE